MGSGRIWVLLVAILTVAGVWALLIVPPETAQALTTEGSGFVEYGAVIGYLICAALVAVLSRAKGFFKLALIVVPIALALREMDMDKRYFTEGLFKSSQYFKGIVSWPEVALSAAIVLFLAACGLMILRSGGASFFAGLRRGEAWVLAICAAIGVAVIAKSLDGLSRKLAPLGIEVSQTLSDQTTLIEEGLELAIPVFLILAILAYGWRDRDGAFSEDER